MDLLSVRQKMVASNIANAATPGYKTKDIDFQRELQSQMGTGATAPPQVSEVSGLSTRNDGNNVSLDREARLLSENALRFNVASQLWKNKMRVLRTAIQDGRNG
ncbi:MAG: flagellar biosynthesis protein FlgB [Acidobacteria bacterium]|nr:flagellar biosynthesis protein FlgB [Acidobacteriota bacterium]